MADKASTDAAWKQVIRARHEFADLAAGLTADQWVASTLCPGWQSRAVVAHIVQTTDASFKILVPHLVKSGFSPNKALGRAAIAMGERESQAQLLEKLQACIEVRKAPPVIGPAGFVADVVVHMQDIRRPLALPGTPDRESVHRALEVSLDAPKAHGNQQRIRALRLVADDLEFSTGDGPAVTGSGEALLMAMWGRSVAVEDLNGEGVATLRSRMPT